jgi:hypothetical protein
MFHFNTQSQESGKDNGDLFADAFAQFLPSDSSQVSGFFGFNGLEKDKCRFSGYFDNGLTSSNPADYTLKVETKEGTTAFDLTSAFQTNANINTPGSEYFKKDFNKDELNCSHVVGKFLVLYLNGSRIGSAEIQAVE